MAAHSCRQCRDRGAPRSTISSRRRGTTHSRSTSPRTCTSSAHGPADRPPMPAGRYSSPRAPPLAARLSGPLFGVEGGARRAVRTSAEPSSTLRVNLFGPGATRTRMRASVLPGEDPTTLATPAKADRSSAYVCRDLPRPASFTTSGPHADEPSPWHEPPVVMASSDRNEQFIVLDMSGQWIAPLRLQLRCDC